MRRPVSLVIMLLAAAALGACGYKGPLYLPKPKADAAKPPAVITPAPDPAPDRPVPGQSVPAPK
jgi:predicted small lipoprotein YifL